jgi:hypothetical protein
MTSQPQTQESRADKIHGLLSYCAFCAVLYGVLQFSERHYWRAGIAVVFFLVVAPWLGTKWINREK